MITKESAFSYFEKTKAIAVIVGIGNLKVKVKLAQSCLILCYPVDYAVHGIIQARILEWVTFPFSRGSS